MEKVIYKLGTQIPLKVRTLLDIASRTNGILLEYCANNIRDCE